jgi:hypothetical protein
MAAVKAAMIDRLNAAVKDGRLTQAEANAIKQRIERGGMPPFFMGPGMPFHGPGAFSSAAYLRLGRSAVPPATWDSLRLSS